MTSTPEDADRPGEDTTPAPPADTPAPRRLSVMSIPDLRPYYDVRQLAQLGPEFAGLARLIWRGARFVGRGLRALGGALAEWMSGRRGGGGSIAARLGIAALGTYAVIRLPLSDPSLGWVMAGALFLAAALTAAGRIPGIKTTGRPGKKSRKTNAPRVPAPRGAAPDEDALEEPEAAPAEAPLTVLLRDLIGDDNGVHLRDLRPVMRDRLPGLAEATDEELRQTLITAGYDPSRKFRSGGAAGRAGVHRDQLPPLPSPEARPSPALRPEDQPRPADSPPPESSRRPAESGPRIVRDPENGPNAWKVHHPGEPAKPPRKRRR